MRTLVVVTVLLAALPSSSCTLLYLFNNDPAGLPCDFTNSNAGECLEDHICIDNVCVKAGVKKPGEACAVSDECEDGFVCGTGYASCETDPDDIQCSLIDDGEKELACRKVCDVNTAAADCGPDQRCFTFGDVAFCQPGVCETDSECGGIQGAEGFCVDEVTLGGKTGFCFEGCNPLICDGETCPDCTGVDGVTDEGSNCIALLDELGPPSGRTMCDKVPANLNVGDTCNPLLDSCPNGSFCSADVGRCTLWCLFPDGAPACPGAGQFCTQVVGDLGRCL